MLGVIISIVSGTLMSIQGVFNTGVTKQAGIWVTASFVQFTALIVCLAAWLVTGRDGSFSALFQVDKKYMLLGGAIGAFITYTVIKGVDVLGPAKAIMLIVAAQLIIAYGIELLGWFGVEQVKFQWRKLIGMGIVIAGIITFKWE